MAYVEGGYHEIQVLPKWTIYKEAYGEAIVSSHMCQQCRCISRRRIASNDGLIIPCMVIMVLRMLFVVVFTV